jgi:hypothetical protein
MNKMLLKRMLYQTVEKLAHLDNQLTDLEASASSQSMPYISSVWQQLVNARTVMRENREAILPLFEETPNKLAEQELLEMFPPLRDQIGVLQDNIYRLAQGQLPSELSQMLSSLKLARLSEPLSALLVVPVASTNEVLRIETQNPVSMVPIDSWLSPLNWVSCLQPGLLEWLEQQAKIKNLADALELQADHTLFASLLAPLMALRLLGPSVYAQVMLEALFSLDKLTLWFVEPLMFQALNRFGLVHKDWVIFHQSLEKSRALLVGSEPVEWTRISLNPEKAEAILQAVEALISEKLAFTEKSMMRAQILEDRLSQGMMIAALPPMTNRAQVLDDLSSLALEASIYPVLRQLKETPAHPREIIAAGWLHKMENGLQWMQAYIGSAKEDVAWHVIRDQIVGLDKNLMKSIETAEVHRVLEALEPVSDSVGAV